MTENCILLDKDEFVPLPNSQSIIEGSSWHLPSYFVDRVLDQEGRGICVQCAVSYWLEFAVSQYKKRAIEMPFQQFIERHGNYDNHVKPW